MENRGKLTQEIKDLSKKLLGYEITEVELRLMPYLQFCMMNEQVLDYNKMNKEDVDVLNKWNGAGFINGRKYPRIKKHFWEGMSQILFIGYVSDGCLTPFEYKKGQLFTVKHNRKGTFKGIAMRDFFPEQETFYPIAVAEGVVNGLKDEWEEGEEVPCRDTLCTLVAIKE